LCELIQRERKQHAVERHELLNQLAELRERIRQLSAEIIEMEDGGEGGGKAQEGKGKGKAPEN
jgi:hypothetical protein